MADLPAFGTIMLLMTLFTIGTSKVLPLFHRDALGIVGRGMLFGSCMLYILCVALWGVVALWAYLLGDANGDAWRAPRTLAEFAAGQKVSVYQIMVLALLYMLVELAHRSASWVMRVCVPTIRSLDAIYTDAKGRPLSHPPIRLGVRSTEL